MKKQVFSMNDQDISIFRLISPLNGNIFYGKLASLKIVFNLCYVNAADAKSTRI